MTSTEQPARCLRPGCGRILTSAASVAAGYGPVCRRRIREAATAQACHGFTPAQVDKARELIADGGMVPTSRPGIFRASSSDGVTIYLVAATGQCTCPAAVRSGRADRCYHVLAARLLTAGTCAARKAA